MRRKYSSLGPSVSVRAAPRWPFLSSAATNLSKLVVVSVAIAAAVITAVSVHNLYPVDDPITPIGYLDRKVNSLITYMSTCVSSFLRFASPTKSYL